MNKKITKTDIKMLVADSVRETLEDPDLGLELSEHAKKRLRQARKPSKSISLSELKKKLTR